MEEEIKKGHNLYQCKDCGLHYEDQKLAEKCEAWCKEHKSCNVGIMKQSEESKGDNPSSATIKNISNSSELEMCNKKCEEYLNNWKRSAADFINYKKDEVGRAALLVGYAKEDIILNILPILDSIYLSEKHSDILQNVRISDNSENFKIIEWIKGFAQIKKQITEFLDKEGIEEIKTVGEKFNPETMEAVGEIEGGDEGTIAEELQKGYKIGGKVIRPAKVKVTK